MANTQEIKRRIKGIGSIKQITKAMELVSTAKFRRARLQLEATRPYYDTVLASIQEVLTAVTDHHPLLEKREEKTVLYIVLTSDRGLAGGYNSNINHLVQDLAQERDSTPLLITVGSKAKEYFKRRDFKIHQSLVGFGEDPTYEDATKLADMAMDLYTSREIDAIDLVFTRFESILQHEPQVVRLLPSKDITRDETQAQALVDFEPSPDEVLDYLIPKYIESSIYGALIEAQASEQGARRTAMEAATDNAEEIIEELESNYNRVRQAAITSEITEIVAASDAIQ